MESSIFLTDTSLLEFVNKCKEPRSYLINDFVMKGTTSMWYGQPAVGKSTLIAQIICQSSCGQPVFGAFEVPSCLKSCYFSFERTLDEIGERVYHMGKVIPVKWSNIYLSDHFIGIDLLQPNQVDYFLKSIDSIGRPDIVYLDPIYAAIRGGLSQDEKATAFTRVSAQIIRKFGCSVVWSHHPVKSEYEVISGEKYKKSKTFYGGVFLEAHIQTSFKIEKCDLGTLWINEKDSAKALPKRFMLAYDASTYLSHSTDRINELSKQEQFSLFFNECFRDGKSFTIKDVIQGLRISDRYARTLVNLDIVKSSCTIETGKDGIQFYKPFQNIPITL